MKLFGLSLSSKKLSPGQFLGELGVWWRRWSTSVFFVLFLIVFGIGVFTWYWSLNLYHWGPDEEKEYRLSKNKQVKFQREKFDAALELLNARAGKYQETSPASRDLFFGE